MTITAIEAPNGTASTRAISTVGIEISASTTTTETPANAVCRDTQAATNSSPSAAATSTVRITMSRSVREPAISQLNTSAPVPSVPSQCSAEGDCQVW